MGKSSASSKSSKSRSKGSKDSKSKDSKSKDSKSKSSKSKDSKSKDSKSKDSRSKSSRSGKSKDSRSKSSRSGKSKDSKSKDSRSSKNKRSKSTRSGSSKRSKSTRSGSKSSNDSSKRHSDRGKSPNPVLPKEKFSETWTDSESSGGEPHWTSQAGTMTWRASYHIHNDEEIDLHRPLSMLEAQILREVNRIRTHPHREQIVRALEERRRYYDGKVLRIPGQKAVLTKEGIKAVNETLRFLDAQEKVAPLKLHPAMCAAALIQSSRIAEGLKDQSISKPMKVFGDYDRPIAMLMAFGKSNAMSILLQLLVSDGHAERETRKDLFSDRFKYIGVSVNMHPKYGHCAIIYMANNFNAHESDIESFTVSDHIEYSGSD